MASSGEEISDVVLRRLKEHGDFPAMAETIVKVNSVTNDEDSSASQLAHVILEDYSLTNKVLRVVNSAIFAQTAEVTTISRAIVVLGWKSIQRLVLTLKLFDSLPEGADSETVKKRLGASFLSGVLARNVANGSASALPEEAFICALFHSFGETLVTFFLPEKDAEIRRRVEELNKALAPSVRRVLGMSYSDVGRIVARELNFPELVLESMKPSPRLRNHGQPTRAEATTGIAALSGAMAQVLIDEDPDAKKKLKQMMKSFEAAYGKVSIPLDDLVEKSVAEFEEHAAAMNLPVSPKRTAHRVRRNYGVIVEREKEEARAAKKATQVEEKTERIFSDGIRDATTSLVSKSSLSEMLVVVLETMYRGLSFAGASRAVFLMRNADTDELRYRSGVGAGLEDAGNWLRVPSRRGGIFHVALEQQKDLYIESLPADDAKRLLPPALEHRVQGGAFFVVLPIVVGKSPIGVFSIDGHGDVALTDKHMKHLAVLRDQVVLAIRQSSSKAA